MLRKHHYFLLGAGSVLLPLLAVVAVKYYGVFELRPDRYVAYKILGKQSLELHVFEPGEREADGLPTPALLLFHGGGWQYGGPEQFYRHCRFFSARGFTCISAQYRTESVYGTDPRAAIEDAYSAFSFVHAQARSLNINPAAIIVGGGSSGGHLAAALGVALPLAAVAGFPTLPGRPLAAILLSPMLDLSPCMPNHHAVRDYWLEVSPRQHIDAATPATLILVGTEDTEVSVATVTDYCEAVQTAGSACEVASYEGAKHGAFQYKVANGRYFDAGNERIMQFLQQRLSSPTGAAP